MSDEQNKKTLLEMAEKEFNEEVDHFEDLPLHIYNYISELKKKLALMSDYAKILEDEKKLFRDLLNDSREGKIKLQIRNDQMTKALEWFNEPDRPIGSDAEMISSYTKMIKLILDE